MIQVLGGEQGFNKGLDEGFVGHSSQLEETAAALSRR